MKHYSKFFLAISLAAAGCAWRQTPVPLEGDEKSVDMLVGSWAGDYTSKQTGRNGSIAFQLAAENDSAYGDIVMVSRPHDFQGATADRPRSNVVIAPVVIEPLKIRFVRAEGGRITGTLDPYKDPDCGCTLTTTFQGGFTSPDRIEGTYHSRGNDFGHIPADGTWSVTRQKPGTR